MNPLHRLVAVALALTLVGAACGGAQQRAAAPTPEPTAALADPTATPAPSPTPQPTEPATPTASPTATPSSSPAPTPTPLPTPLPTSTPTPSATPTPLPTPTPTPTASPTPTPTPSPTPTPTPSPTPTPTPREGEQIVWRDSSVFVRLNEGWTISSCQGSATILCLDRRGNLAGTIEVLAFPLESLGNLQRMVDRGEATSMLDAFVVDYHEGIETDRVTCGPRYRVTRHDVVERQLAGRGAVRYGFTGARANGDVAESTVGWAAIIREHLVLAVATAHDERSCVQAEDVFFTSDRLARLVPELDTFMATLRLPDRLFPHQS